MFLTGERERVRERVGGGGGGRMEERERKRVNECMNKYIHFIYNRSGFHAGSIYIQPASMRD